VDVDILDKHEKYTNNKNFNENYWNSGENMQLNVMIQSNFFDEINYWMQDDFQNNSDREVTET